MNPLPTALRALPAVLLIAACGAGEADVADQSAAGEDAAMVATVDGIQTVAMKGINYYPATHPWAGTWNAWNPQEVADELDYAQQLGCDTVETYIPYPAFFKNGQVDAAMVQHASDFLALAHDRQLKVLFTLFDGIGSISQSEWADHEKFLEGVVVPLSQRSHELGGALRAWGLRNEVNLLAYHGVSNADVVAWGTHMLAKLRSLDPGRPVEIEVTYIAGPELAPLMRQASWVGISYYPESADATAMEGILKRIYGMYGRPVLITEIGWSTHLVSEARQAQEYATVAKLAARLQLGLRPWTLVDFDIADPKQSTFGLVGWTKRSDGTLRYATKQAFDTFQAWRDPWYPEPCRKIVHACENDGFYVNGSNVGLGLWSDCVDPIMAGKSQAAGGKKPVPQVNPDTVSKCAAEDAHFPR